MSDYLIERLQEMGVRHVFGVPGDYVLSFFKKLSESSLCFWERVQAVALFEVF